MAVAVGRNVALAGGSCIVSNPNRTLNDSMILSWVGTVRVSLGRPGVSLASGSGRSLSWRVCEQPKARWEVRACKDGTAEELFVDNDVVELLTSNGLQLYNVERDTSGANLLLEFEGLLTKKSLEVTQLHTGAVVFLVGMMASGKSTVARIVADALGFEFRDSDDLIESYEGGLSVKEIFRRKTEDAFRDLETRALEELSKVGRKVVATGGGAVVRNENWTSLRKGITIWLDVPVEDLAKRVTTVGTESRPLLGEDSADFEKAFPKLSLIMECRKPHYAKACRTLSLRDLASRLGLREVSLLTPTAIAVQVLEEILHILRQQ